MIKKIVEYVVLLLLHTLHAIAGNRRIVWTKIIRKHQHWLLTRLWRLFWKEFHLFMEFWLVFVTTLNRNASAASRVPSTFSAKTSGGVDKVRYVCYAQLCCGSVFTSFVEMNVSFLRNVQLCFHQTATVPKQGRMTSLFCTNAKCCGTLLWHIVKTMIFPTFLRIYQRTSRKASEFLFHIYLRLSLQPFLHVLMQTVVCCR